MSFKVRTWALGKTVSSLALIVSTWWITASAVIPVTLADNNNNGAISSDGGGGNSYSNITILDLYPELKQYLWEKALAQLEQSTTTESYNNLPNLGTQAQNGPSAWDYSSLLSNFNLNANTNTDQYANVNSAGSAFAREGYDPADSDPMETYNQHSEILKHYHPFGSPEIYSGLKYKQPPLSHSSEAYSGNSGWKYKPVSPPSYSTNHFPIWDEEEPDFTHHVGYELSKDFSCVAGLLGLKTLKKLKIASVFKKLKLIAVFFIAFKLGLFLSPIAIPLLFPVILIATIAKILPLVLIIVLLLKLLKKQVKLKKPLGKFLDQTGSLFFEDIDTVTERVMKSRECVDKISCELSRKSSGKVRRVNNKRLDDDLDETKSSIGDN